MRCRGSWCEGRQVSGLCLEERRESFLESHRSPAHRNPGGPDLPSLFSTRERQERGTRPTSGGHSVVSGIRPWCRQIQKPPLAPRERARQPTEEPPTATLEGSTPNLKQVLYIYIVYRTNTAFFVSRFSPAASRQKYTPLGTPDAFHVALNVPALWSPEMSVATSSPSTL